MPDSIFSQKYRNIIKRKTFCNETCSTPDDPNKIIPGVRRRTKTEYLVEVIKHTRGGKTYYGDNPELYVYSNQPLDIINGIRGGIIPTSLRTNKF